MCGNKFKDMKKKYVRILKVIQDSNIKLFKGCLYINETDLVNLTNEIRYSKINNLFNKKYTFEYSTNYFYLKCDGETLVESDKGSEGNWNIIYKKSRLEGFYKVYVDYFFNELANG